MVFTPNWSRRSLHQGQGSRTLAGGFLLVLLASVLFLVGFPGSGPLLTSGASGIGVQQGPPGYVHTREANVIRERIASLQRTPTPESDRAVIVLPLVQGGQAVSPAQEATPTPAPTPTAAPTPDGLERSVRVPILMYHYLSVPPADADIYRLDLSVTPDRFAEHLAAMRDAGYTAIGLYDLLLHLTRGEPLPPKPVIITFDDGYRDNYENAFPLLQAFGMTATFFVVTDFMDEERPAYMTWEMAREMQAGGMSIESHGRNHISLRNRDDAYLIWQALGSAETIEFELGKRPRFTAYPSGQYDDNTIRIFREAGYWMGLTTVQGATHTSDDLFQLQRVRVRGTTSAQDLLRLLEHTR